jgi:hypothetical protein
VVDEELIKELEGMGFGRNRAVRAVYHSGGAGGLTALTADHVDMGAELMCGCICVGPSAALLGFLSWRCACTAAAQRLHDVINLQSILHKTKLRACWLIPLGHSHTVRPPVHKFSALTFKDLHRACKTCTNWCPRADVAAEVFACVRQAWRRR